MGRLQCEISNSDIPFNESGEFEEESKMNRQAELVRAREYEGILRIALVIAIVGAFALPGTASQAVAKGGGGGKVPPDDPSEPFTAWERWDDAWPTVYGVKATFNVVDPTYTTDTHSVVAYSVTATVEGGSWIQAGYLKGWWVFHGPGGAVWREASVPTVYFEYFNADTLSHGLEVRPAIQLEMYTYHTWSIYWDYLTGNWEVYYDDYHLTSQSWLPDISASELIVQGECRDTDDLSNGAVYFSDISYYTYEIFGGRLGNPSWELWDLPTDEWGFDSPWTSYASTSAYVVWINT